MIKVEISGDNEEELELFLQHLCYSITEESLIQLECPQWNGYSGGDDAYFGLEGRIVQIKKKD